MTSIRKAKKALKREIQRIDAGIIELLKHEGTASAMWDLFLWRNYFERMIKSLGKDDFDPWSGKIHKPIPFPQIRQDQFLTLIKGEK